METSFLLGLVGLTSAVAGVVGARVFGLPLGRLGDALGRMFETLGIVVLFFAVNLAVGALTILAVRAAGSRFVSLYVADDVALLALSFFQGLAFQAWRGSGQGGLRH